MKEGVFLEIDIFSRKKQEDNQKILSESLYVLTSISRVLLCLLESPIYEKNYSLIDDILLILDEIIICIEKKGIIETIQTVFNPIIQNYFLIVMKWEDYLKNSWDRLKVLFISLFIKNINLLLILSLLIFIVKNIQHNDIIYIIIYIFKII